MRGIGHARIHVGINWEHENQLMLIRASNSCFFYLAVISKRETTKNVLTVSHRTKFDFVRPKLVFPFVALPFVKIPCSVFI